MKNIVITGATGVLGWRTVRDLLAAGHRVAGVTRSDRGRRLLSDLGARPIEADVYDEAALTAAFDGADAVVNLLTKIPDADRMGDLRAWEENDRLRSEASAAIARAAQAAGASRLVQESLAFLYVDGGEGWLDESSPTAGASRTGTALVAEANAQQQFAGDTVVLRFGFFIAPDSALTLGNVEAARQGISPTVGRRDAYWPTIWLDDAASAVVAALGVPAGTYNVVDDDPPTRGESDAALAAVVGRDVLRPFVDEVPPELEQLARSHRVSNRRLREAAGWAPRVHGGTEGWGLIAKQRQAA